MLRTAMIGGLALSALMGCGEGAEPGVPDAGNPDAMVDAAALTNLLQSEQLTGLGTGELSSISAHEDAVFVGTPHGLFRGEAPTYALARMSTLREVRSLVAIASFHDELFVAGRDGLSAVRLLRSTDAGQTWTDVSPESLADTAAEDVQFTSSAERLVLGAGPHQWNAEDERWELIDTTVAVPGTEETSTAFLGPFGLEGNKLYASVRPWGAPEEGAYSLDLAAAGATWERVDALNEWGYAAFAFDPLRAVTSNDTQIFVRTPEAWPAVFTVEDAREGLPAVDLFVRDGVILAAGASKLRRSTDGAVWTEVLDEGAASRRVFAATDERIFAITKTLRGSADLGATWTTYDSEIAVPSFLTVRAGAVHAAVGRSFFRVAAASSTFERFAEFESAGALVAVSADDLWACSEGGCLRISLDTGFSRNVAQPDEILGFRLIWATRFGVFAADTNWQGSSCGNGQAPTARSAKGLFRFDEASGTWRHADEGLPAVVDCDGVRGFKDIVDLFEIDGALFASSDRKTFRSADGGVHWEPVVSLGELRDVATCGASVVAMLADGTFASSRDGGVTFAPFALGVENVVAIASLASGCVVGTSNADGLPTLFTSADGASFEAVDGFAEPVHALASDGLTLAVSTASRGVLRLTHAD